jgi:hypothetical protein
MMRQCSWSSCTALLTSQIVVELGREIAETTKGLAQHAPARYDSLGHGRALTYTQRKGVRTCHTSRHTAFWAWGCCSALPWEGLQPSGRSSTSTPTRGRVPSNSPATAMGVIGLFSRAAMIPPERRRLSRHLLHTQVMGKMSATAADIQVGFVIFGACTPF